ncbi:hypothetical protein [Methylobacterium sp. Leaf456]|uniref:hypothetical protein n=1 Tax=Methylobacterium sp. Leaf456 TaxID=1736382 RepID=UPI000A4D753E|nr:hypothetical protein [Methylobacterium sp. Leaf456]
MALVTDMVVNEAMGARGPDRGCVLTEDRADALECAANRLTALSLALGRAYGDATSA